ncbi:hypothetical protein GCM10011341_35860 [Frigidibacter albus]|nr:hypothetical protein GCM10011341_35860 [Frigidibacter albus]
MPKGSFTSREPGRWDLTSGLRLGQRATAAHEGPDMTAFGMAGQITSLMKRTIPTEEQIIGILQ